MKEQGREKEEGKNLLNPDFLSIKLFKLCSRPDIEHVDIAVENLIYAKAQVNFIDSETGDTPLHIAVQYCKDVDILDILCKNGANINIEDKIYANKPIHRSVMYGNVKTLKYFIKEKHISPKILDSEGMDLLFYAKYADQKEVEKYLQKYLNEKNNISKICCTIS